jgi:hypothetical protein
MASVKTLVLHRVDEQLILTINPTMESLSVAVGVFLFVCVKSITWCYQSWKEQQRQVIYRFLRQTYNGFPIFYGDKSDKKLPVKKISL